MCELYNCILNACTMSPEAMNDMSDLNIQECQILGHEGALGLPDVVFFKFCCTVLKSSTNCTT